METRQKTNKIHVSIVIPAYNAARYLAETLEGAQAQTRTDWELILVDDGSTDETAALAQTFADRDPRIRVLSKANAGVSAARNFGLAHACPDSEFVIFLDADDVWEPDTLLLLLTALNVNPQAVAVYGLACTIDSAGKPLRPGELERNFRQRYILRNGRLERLAADQPLTFASLALFNWVPTTGTILLRRTALTKAGDFDPDIVHSEDWDLWLRLACLGDIAFLNRVILRYRRHDGNATAQARKMLAGEDRVRGKLLAAETNPERGRLLQMGAFYRPLAVSRIELAMALGCLRRGEIVRAAKRLRHGLRIYLGARNRLLSEKSLC